MDRRAFLKYAGAAGSALGSLAFGLSATLGTRARAAVNWAGVKGKFTVDLRSRELGHVTGTLNIKKNKTVSRPGWRELIGEGKASQGKLKGWIWIQPNDDNTFQIGRYSTKRRVITWITGTGQVSADGSVITGTYLVRQGNEGEALVPVENGSFTLTRV